MISPGSMPIAGHKFVISNQVGDKLAPLVLLSDATAYGLHCYQLAMERAADLAYDAAIRYSQGYAVDFKAEFALQEKTDV